MCPRFSLLSGARAERILECDEGAGESVRATLYLTYNIVRAA